LRAADDHQDQSQREHQPAQQAGHAVGQSDLGPRCRAGHHNRGEQSAERNEGTGQDRQGEQRRRIGARLPHAEILGRQRDRVGHPRIEKDRRNLAGHRSGAGGNVPYVRSGRDGPCRR
jgi:hypothetical protein